MSGVIHLDDPSGVLPFEADQRDRPTEHIVAPNLKGPLQAGAGARLLLKLFVERRSGRLDVTGSPGLVGTLFFLEGEPVHAQPTDADGALLRRLDQRGQLHPAARDAKSFSTSLITSLVRRRWAKPLHVLEALRDEVREFARALVGATAGTYGFYDDVEFVHHTPLTTTNPFGLVIEARRRAMAPDVLFRIGEEVLAKIPCPRPGFANVASRVRSFTGHVDWSTFVDGTRPASELFRLSNLDPLVGGLVLHVLVDTDLIELLDSPRAEAVIDAPRAPTSVLPLLVPAEPQQLSQLARLPDRGGQEILALYLDLKPEIDDDVILGTDPDAPPAAIERGYQARLAELDPRAIPSGPARPYLLGRVEELRTKVERTYRARMAGAPRSRADAYEILEKIGEGGMAEVFRGRATDDPSRIVAIKRILPTLRMDANFARMFLEEARLARRVRHPNVVAVFTVGKSGDDLYLAMEFVDGWDLGELLRRSRKLKRFVPVEVAARIVADACGGLHAAHTAHDPEGKVTPILHRDVSPQNILVSVHGDVKLSDFGIAKAQEGSHTAGESTGLLKGKASYLAPELVEGLAPASIKSDVYAIGLTLYATLFRNPYTRADAIETMNAIVSSRLPPPSMVRPDVPKELDRIILRACARDPEARPASAQHLQLELEEWLATRPSVDVGGWVRSLPDEKAPKKIAPPPNPTITTISEDVDLNDL